MDSAPCRPLQRSLSRPYRQPRAPPRAPPPGRVRTIQPKSPRAPEHGHFGRFRRTIHHQLPRVRPLAARALCRRRSDRRQRGGPLECGFFSHRFCMFESQTYLFYNYEPATGPMPLWWLDERSPIRFRVFDGASQHQSMTEESLPAFCSDAIS